MIIDGMKMLFAETIVFSSSGNIGDYALIGTSRIMVTHGIHVGVFVSTTVLMRPHSR